MAKSRWKIFVNEVLDPEGETLSPLREEGCEVILGKPIGEFPGYSEEEMLHICKGVDGLMGASRDPYTGKVIASSRRLQVISKYGIGVEKIDLKAADQHGVLVCNTPIDEDVEAVAEHTIALILALVKRLKKVTAHLKAGGWRDFSIELGDLWGKAIGIIGLGRIGLAVAERLQNWGTRLLYYDPFVEKESLQNLKVEKTSLEVLLRDSDIVTLHLAAKPETYHFLNRERLRLMKATAYLINTSRGEVIDERALLEALRENWIGGAGLDVFEREPLPSAHPLLAFEQVILTPHVAGWTPRSKRRISEIAVENCLSVLRGKVPSFLVNPEALPRWKERVNRRD
jgi:D-3-phosphoglycerate dehydrogenase